ncbi:restriction endonuclease subunit S [Flavobacterium sp. TP390]|uniref:Restriction endonuclease subunit S n=1 Tax=Flavobacterium profundi TaxID=1774945 RepID=A0A6I4ISU5_9FLAO|nr:restriction endonuclease subunit S [Flavobacterium profundi]MVO09897.1 restriction endonuclease subunit S [Flavobacterium profundi]
MKKYEKYKPTNIEWIGDIPEHWKISKVKYNFSFRTGFTPPSGKSEYYNDGNNVWINIGDLDGKYISDSSNKITDKAIEDLNPTIVPKGSLLYSFKLSVGKVAFTEIDCYTNEAIFSIDPDNEDNLEFFYYALPQQIIKNANENIYGAKILNQELIKNADLIIPPPHEQTLIANYLNKKTQEIDQLIEDKKQLYKLIKEEKTALINQVITKGITSSQNLKNSNIEFIGEIPENWNVKKIKHIVSKVGSGVTPSGGASVYELTGIPLLRSQNIHFDGLRLDDVAYINEDIHNSMKNSKVHSGDVLLNITGASIGRCFYVDETLGEANVNQHVSILRPNNKVLTKYLYYILYSNIGQEQIRKEQTGSGREGLNFEVLKNFQVPLPEISEQESIINYIELHANQMEFRLMKTKKLIDLLTEYRSALISDVVTGKVKVIE